MIYYTIIKDSLNRNLMFQCTTKPGEDPRLALYNQAKLSGVTVLKHAPSEKPKTVDVTLSDIYWVQDV